MNKIILAILMSVVAIAHADGFGVNQGAAISGTSVNGWAAAGAVSTNNSGAVNSSQGSWTGAWNKTTVGSRVGNHNVNANINSSGSTLSKSLGTGYGATSGLAIQYGGGTAQAGNSTYVGNHHSGTYGTGEINAKVSGVQGSVAYTRNVGTGDSYAFSRGAIKGNANAYQHIDTHYNSVTVYQDSTLDVSANGYSNTNKVGGGSALAVGGGYIDGSANTTSGIVTGNGYDILETLYDGTD